MSDPTTPGGDAGAAPASAPRVDNIVPFTGAPAPDPAKTETFRDKLERGVQNLADVTVATVVSDVKITFDKRGRLASVESPDAKVPAIITNINLVDGNVTTIIGTEIKDDTALGTFHQGIVDKAVKVLPNNIKTLVDVFKGLFDKS